MPNPGDIDPSTGKPYIEAPDGDNKGNPPEPGKTTDWEAAYKGLQKQLNTLQTSSAKTISDLTQKSTDLQTQLDAANAKLLEKDGVITTKETELKKLSDDLTGEKANSGKALSDLKRAKLIMKEFPDLAPMESAEILPVATDETELRTKLTAFKEVLKTQLGLQLQQTLQGGSPPPPTNDGGSHAADETEDDLWAKMMQYGGVHGKEKEYEAAYQKWLALQKQKK